METREEFTRRLKLVGLQKQQLAKLMGVQKSSVSRYGASGLMHHRPIPVVAETIIRAWQIMSPDQRGEWLNGEDQ